MPSLWFHVTCFRSYVDRNVNIFGIAPGTFMTLFVWMAHFARGHMVLLELLLASLWVITASIKWLTIHVKAFALWSADGAVDYKRAIYTHATNNMCKKLLFFVYKFKHTRTYFCPWTVLYNFTASQLVEQVILAILAIVGCSYLRQALIKAYMQLEIPKAAWSTLFASNSVTIWAVIHNPVHNVCHSFHLGRYL